MNIKQFMILNASNLYIIESFSSENLSGIPDNTHTVATLFARLKTGRFQRLEGVFASGGPVSGTNTFARSRSRS